MNMFLPYDENSLVVRPLTELPMLRLADQTRDVRGWDVHGDDGGRLGSVVDLLVDIDRLRADTLLVSLSGGDHAGGMAVVPLHRLSPENGGHRRLVAGQGMPAIVIQYQSTTRYVVWVVIALSLIALAGWILGFFR